MSHQVIITFDLDENKIQENAEKEAGRQIAKEIKDKVFGQPYQVQTNMKRYVEDIIKDILMEDKDKIINSAIKNVTDSINRSKALKSKLEEC